MSDTTADELAIRTLVARYCDAVARKDAADWGDTWADDGAWQLMGQTSSGREAVVERWNQLMAGFSFVLQTPNFGVIELSGDSATGRWYVTEQLRGKDDSVLLTMGVYHDEYTRTQQGWRFQQRRFDALYMGTPDGKGQLIPFPSDL